MDVLVDFLFGICDGVARRIRQIGGTVRSLDGTLRLRDTEGEYTDWTLVRAKFGADIQAATIHMRAAQNLCQAHSDNATAILINGWIDQIGRGRSLFLD